MKQTFQLKVIFTFVFLILGGLEFSFGQVEPQSNLSKVELTGKAIKLGKNEWECEFNLENKGNNTIYFAANPTQTNNERGYYVSFDIASKTVTFSSRIFQPSLYSPYSDDTSVELKKLNKGEIFNGKIFLKFPLKETIPPIDNPYKIKDIAKSKIKKIELTIGYFGEEEGVIDFLKVKPFGWYINGNETFFSGKYKGKPFFEIQKLVNTNIVL